MRHDPLKASVLATRIIPNVSTDFSKRLNLPDGFRSIAIITADSDDVMYTALDEATKKAAVKVVYARSFYGGAANANTKLAGEVIGIIAGENPDEVRSGLDVCVNTIENGIDAALKAADVRICELFAPPSETNFGGALLTGTQSACQSACDAFGMAVEYVADNPIE